MSTQYTFPIKYQHILLGPLSDVILNLFKDTIFQGRFNQVLKANSAKAIQYLKQHLNSEQSIVQGGLFPLLSVSFNLLTTDDRTNFLWRYGRIGGNFISKIKEPIYKDDDIELFIGTQRYVGNSDINIFATSQPEIHDMLIRLQQYFPIPRYTISNEYTNLLSYITLSPSFTITYLSGETKTIDLTGTFDTVRVKAIDKDRLAIPFGTSLLLRMETAADGSAILSGSEAGDYRLNASLTWELEVPVFCLLRTAYDLSQKTIIDIQNDLTISHLETLISKDVSLTTYTDSTGEFELGQISHLIFNEDSKEEIIDLDGRTIDTYHFSLMDILSVDEFTNVFAEGYLGAPTKNLLEIAYLLIDKKIDQVCKAFGWIESDVKGFLWTEDLTQTFDEFSNTFDGYIGSSGYSGYSGSLDPITIIQNLMEEYGIPIRSSKRFSEFLKDLDLNSYNIWSLYSSGQNIISDINETTRFCLVAYRDKLSDLKDYDYKYDPSKKDVMFTLYNRYESFTVMPLKVFIYHKVNEDE